MEYHVSWLILKLIIQSPSSKPPSTITSHQFPFLCFLQTDLSTDLGCEIILDKAPTLGSESFSDSFLTFNMFLLDFAVSQYHLYRPHLYPHCSTSKSGKTNLPNIKFSLSPHMILKDTKEHHSQ